jgi:parallel beta-helix repeat protein/predicted outer membrane repeat protein
MMPGYRTKMPGRRAGQATLSEKGDATMFRGFIAIAGLILLCTPLNAALITVPDNYPTIQQAIEASNSGDTVRVRPGTYFENIDFAGKAIIVESEKGPAVTIIDGGQADSVVVFQSFEGEGSVLRGFTVTNGRADNGGGIRCRENTSPTIAGNTITLNTAERYGAGIYCLTSAAVIIDNTISDNTTVLDWAGGGIACWTFSSATISRNTITGNFPNGILCFNNLPPPSPVPVITITDNVITGNAGPWHGGGIHCFSARGDIRRNTISGNSAGHHGGGIYLFQNQSTVIGNVISENTAGDSGGGICCWSAVARISANIISENRAELRGGGISCRDNCHDRIIDNLISRNTVSGSGGGIHCGGSYSTIFRNIISENDATGNGGGIQIYNSCPDVAGNRISENTAGNSGGGISCQHLSFPYVPELGFIANNNIVDNSAVNDGGGICSIEKSSPSLVNNTVLGNNASRGGGVCCLDSSSSAIANTILRGNVAPTAAEIFTESSDTVANHCNVEGGWPGTGNIDVDPLFVDPSAGDYHLTFVSPCIDAGDMALIATAVDFEGDPRHGAGADIGADEFFVHLYHIGAVVPGCSISIKAVGKPRDPMFLALGTGIQDPPQSTRYGDLYLRPSIVNSWNLGPIPADGILARDVTLPAGIAPGTKWPFQALVGPWKNSGGRPGKLSNLMTLTVE